MAIITVTPEPAYGSIRIDLVAEAGDTEITQVARIVDGVDGTAPQVRTKANQLPAAFPLTVRDYESPLNTSVRYIVWYESSAGLTAVWSEYVTLTTTAPVMLTVVGQPNIQAALPMVLDYDAETDPEVSVMWAIGATYPRYSLGPVRARSGTFSTVVPDLATVKRIETVYKARQPVLLRQSDQPGLDMFHVSTSLRHGPADARGRQWLVEVGYAEVADPTMPLIGATGWTYDSVRTTYSTYADVLTEYGTYGDLLVGPLS